MRVDVTAEQVAGQVITITHDCKTKDVLVTCYGSDGQPVGYLAAVPFGADGVDVVVDPGSGVTQIEVTDVLQDAEAQTTDSPR